MLKIRLSRTGKKHQPYYRIVVAEHTASVSGKYVDLLGHYNPRSKELVINNDQVTKWLNLGAKPSNTIAKMLTKGGLKHKLVKVHLYPERAAKKEVDQASAKVPAATNTNPDKNVTATDDQQTVAETTEAASDQTPTTTE